VPSRHRFMVERPTRNLDEYPKSTKCVTVRQMLPGAEWQWF
jgi:hypothetical protein